ESAEAGGASPAATPSGVGPRDSPATDTRRSPISSESSHADRNDEVSHFAFGLVLRSCPSRRRAHGRRSGTWSGYCAAVGGPCIAASGDRTGLHMGTILLLGLAAAVYPQLLAVVVVILTRP